MKSFAFALLIVGLALLAIPASAAEGGNTTFTLVGKPTTGDFAWFDNSGSSANPTETVPANTEITWTVSSVDDTPHTLKIGDKTLISTPFSQADGQQIVKWTSGTSDTTYVCTLHPNMKGTVHIAGTTTSPPAKSPGVQVVGAMIALVGAALLVARRQS